MAFVTSVDADDRPSWAIIDAADRLIAKNALFLPGGDGFLKQASGLLIQYERPSKSYSRDGKNWIVEIRSPRWRAEAAKEWLPWNDARPQYDLWRIGVIRVDVLISGVEANWVDNTNFKGRTPPSQSEVMHRLNTMGQASIKTPGNQPSRTSQGPASEIRPHRVRSDRSPQGGIYRRLPDGSLEKVSPEHIPKTTTPDSSQSIPTPRLREVPPPPPSPPQVQINPDPTPQLPSNVAGSNRLKINFGWILPLMALVLTAIVAIKFYLQNMRREATIPSNVHSSPVSPLTTSPITPPPLKTNQTTSQQNHLLSPTESSFLNALQKAVSPSCSIAAKIRAGNLFGDDFPHPKKVSDTSFCETLIDFVIYHTLESRILCAIELDENSQARPDRINRDTFLTELFESKQVPLLRVPISWTYYPQGIRAELQKAGIFTG